MFLAFGQHAYLLVVGLFVQSSICLAGILSVFQTCGLSLFWGVRSVLVDVDDAVPLIALHVARNGSNWRWCW